RGPDRSRHPPPGGAVTRRSGLAKRPKTAPLGSGRAHHSQAMSFGFPTQSWQGSSQPVHESSATAFDDCASCRASTIAKIATSRVSPFIPVSFQLAISQAGGIRYAVARLPSDPLVSADIRRHVEEPPGLSGPATDAAGRRVT